MKNNPDIVKVILNVQNLTIIDVPTFKKITTNTLDHLIPYRKVIVFPDCKMRNYNQLVFSI